MTVSPAILAQARRSDWMQVRYDLEVAEEEFRGRIEQEVVKLNQPMAIGSGTG